MDTGPRIFHHKVMLPAGVVERVDEDDEKVYVNRTKEQIKDSPEYDASQISNAGYHSKVGDYYGPGGPDIATSTTTCRHQRSHRSTRGRSPACRGSSFLGRRNEIHEAGRAT